MPALLGGDGRRHLPEPHAPEALVHAILRTLLAAAAADAVAAAAAAAAAVADSSAAAAATS